MSISYQISNVNVFTGEGFEQGTVGIENGLISDNVGNNAELIDGSGKYLIPGLMDCHIHLQGEKVLEKLAQHGVTTAFDMAVWPLEEYKHLLRQRGLPEIKSAGAPATSPGSMHSKFPGLAPYLISSPSEVAGWISARVAEGSDYIKVICDQPGPSQELLDTLTVEAHKYHKAVIAHAAHRVPFEMAVRAGVDIVTHVPSDEPLSMSTISQMLDKCISVPTLTMMEAMSDKFAAGRNYQTSKSSFAALYRAGVPILAGTDANSTPMCPVPYGESLSHELELMVDAGMSTIDALKAATSLPARYFDMPDRGEIKVGLRADLVLLSDNPLHDIRALKSVERVWIGGIEYIRS